MRVNIFRPQVCVVSAEENPVEFAEDKAVVSAAEEEPVACQEIPMA